VILGEMNEAINKQLNPAIQELTIVEVAVQKNTNQFSNALNRIQTIFSDLKKQITTMPLIKISGSMYKAFTSVNKEVKNLNDTIDNFSKNKKDVPEKISDFKKSFENVKKSFPDFKDLPSTMLSGISSAYTSVKNFVGKSPILKGIFSTEKKYLNKGVTGVEKMGNLFQSGFDAVSKKVSPILSSISGNVKNKMTDLGNLISENVSPIIDKVSSSISKGVEIFKDTKLGGMLSSFGDFMSKKIGSVVSLFANEVSGIGSMISTIMSSPVLIAGVVVLIIAALVQLWNSSEEFRTNVMLAIDNIMLILTAVWENILQPIFTGIGALCISLWEVGLQPLWNAWVYLVDVIIGVVLNLWNAIAPVILNIINLIGPIITPVLTALGVAFGTVFGLIADHVAGYIAVVAGVIEGLYLTFLVIFDSIRIVINTFLSFLENQFGFSWSEVWNGIVSEFSEIWDGLKEGVKSGLNFVISYINKAIDGINSIKVDVPDWFPGIGGRTFGFNIPHIPELAQGGIVSKATLGVFGENGTEAVIPLQRNTRGIEMIADKIVANMPKESGNGTYLIQLVLEDGTVLAKKLIKNIKNYEIMTGKPAF